MAATTSRSIEVRVQRPTELAPRWVRASLVVGSAVLLAAFAILISAVAWRSLTPPPAGQGIGTHRVVPHPARGPFGS